MTSDAQRERRLTAPDTARTQLVQSVERAAELLLLISAATGGVRLKDLVSKTGLKPPTVHNLVRTLVKRKLVRRCDGHYLLGQTILQLGERYREQTLGKDGTDLMLDLAAQFPEATITFIEIVDGLVLVTHRIGVAHPGFIEWPAAFKLHAYGSAAGLAAQAFGGEELSASIRRRHPFSEHGIHLWNDLARLERFLAQCRICGYAVLPFPKRDPAPVAVPVHQRAGEFLGIMAGSLPLAVARRGKIKDLTAALLDGVARLTEPGRLIHVREKAK